MATVSPSVQVVGRTSDPVVEVDPLNTGAGEQERIVLAGVEFLDAGADTAPDPFDGQVGPVQHQLCPTAHRRGADPGAGRQIRQLPAVPGDHHIVHVTAFEVGAERRPFRQRHVTGHVLHGMHRDVDPAGDQCPVDLLGEVALPAEQGQVPGPQIGRGLDVHDLHPQARRHALDRGHHPACLSLDERVALVPTRSGALPNVPATHPPVCSTLLSLKGSSLVGHRWPSFRVVTGRDARGSVFVWHEADESEPTPDWLHYMNQAEVDCLAANTYTQLALQADDQRHQCAYAGRAEYHTVQARRSRANGYDRSRILDEIRLARVRLSQRELDESVTVATAALGLAGTVRSSVVCDWLIRFHAELVERHARECSVSSFTDSLREYLRQAAPLREGDVVVVD